MNCDVMFVVAHAAVILLKSMCWDTLQTGFSISSVLLILCYVSSMMRSWISVSPQSLCMTSHLPYRCVLSSTQTC